jgi:2-succinyl-5-enolpyruvyl-6-hydroxy-3-cyclohexene-1-carboxylate synthase
MSASPSAEGSPAHLLGEWARLLLATLRDAGVRDLWVSPGSRSTPFTWAALRTEGLTLRSVIDERSAAFLALGHARITGRPCALLCTSGSAAANYFPAIVEASLAYLPLVILAADRPLDVQHSAAAQTIDQTRLYGEHVRLFFDLGLPEATPSALVGVRRLVAQAVATAQGPLPGPVHLNLRARKPLEPSLAVSEAERALSQTVSQLLTRPIARHAPIPGLANEAVLATARTVRESASGCIVVGPLPAYSKNLAEPIGELSRLTGFPIFAEASSQLRFALADHANTFPLYDWLLSAPELAATLRPELLLCVGHTPTSSAFERWAATAARRVVLAEHGYPDALGSAELVASGQLDHALASLLKELRSAPSVASTALVESLREAHERCAALVRSAASEPRTEAEAVTRAVAALPEGAALVLGNSLPIRDVDAYVTRAAALRVISQRGANGIDGLVSGAIGSAVASGAPTLLLIGDVSLFHDLGALASSRLVKTPLVIAVIDNAGGRIFDQLPVQKLYSTDARAAELWLTPPTGQLSHAAKLFGLEYFAPTTGPEIQAIIAAQLAQPGVSLVHLQVEPHSAARSRQKVLEALGLGPAHA